MGFARFVAVAAATLLVTATAVALAPTACRAASWGPVEVMPLLGVLDQLGPVKTDPLGNYYVNFGAVSGFAKGREKFFVRSPGANGPRSGPQSIPRPGTKDVDFEFDAAGNSWWIWATGSKIEIAKRAAGLFGAFSTAIQLDAGPDCSDAAVGVSPAGDLLAVWTKGQNLLASVREANAEAFSEPQVIANEPSFGVSGGYIVFAHRLWAVLDASGSALITWEQWPLPGGPSELKQSARSASPLDAPAFGAATSIVASPYQVFYAEGLGKHAVLAWKKDEGAPGSSSNNFSLSATKRSPGGSFTLPGTLLSDEEEYGIGVRDVQVSVAADGEAAVSWHEFDPDGGPCPRPEVLAMVGRSGPGGGGIGPAEVLAEGDTFPADPAVGVAGGGNWVAGWDSSRLDGKDPCGPLVSEIATLTSGGDEGLYQPSEYDQETLRAAAQPASGGGYEGLVVWIDVTDKDIEMAHFGDPLVTTTTTSSTTTTTVAPAPLCGDANGSGGLSASDALLALRAAVGQVSCLLCLCDATGDAKVSAPDALAILRASVSSGILEGCPGC